MIRGIASDEVSGFVVKEYDGPGDAAELYAGIAWGFVIIAG